MSVMSWSKVAGLSQSNPTHVIKSKSENLFLKIKIKAKEKENNILIKLTQIPDILGSIFSFCHSSWVLCVGSLVCKDWNSIITKHKNRIESNFFLRFNCTCFQRSEAVFNLLKNSSNDLEDADVQTVVNKYKCNADIHEDICKKLANTYDRELVLLIQTKSKKQLKLVLPFMRCVRIKKLPVPEKYCCKCICLKTPELCHARGNHDCRCSNDAHDIRCVSENHDMWSGNLHTRFRKEYGYQKLFSLDDNRIEGWCL